MAMSDDRQRVMPTPFDRSNGKVLDYPEAVLLTKYLKYTYNNISTVTYSK